MQAYVTFFTFFFAESEGFLRRVRDSNPRYDVMRIPHFECGSFDHSDNSPRVFAKSGCKGTAFF